MDESSRARFLINWIKFQINSLSLPLFLPPPPALSPSLSHFPHFSLFLPHFSLLSYLSFVALLINA